MVSELVSRRFKGFTLAELLIALAILGVIATFTIPKVLQSQQDSKYKAIAKEAAGTVEAAYGAYRQQNIANAATRVDDLTPYMNYVKRDTSGTWEDDSPNSGGPSQCTATNGCLLLHNGALLTYNPGMSFNGTGTTNALVFWVDPDGGTNNGSARGAYESVGFWLYYNGRMATHGTAIAGSTNSQFSFAVTDPTKDPSWFSWN